MVLLSSLYTVPLRCSCGWDCREHEFLDLREYHVWLKYDVRYRRTHCFIQRGTVTLATPRTETYTLHWAIPGTKVYNYAEQVPGPNLMYVLLRQLPGTEVLLWRLGGGELPPRKLALPLPHFRLSLGALIRRDVVSDTCITPDRI
jgi:hypothetical protein